MRNDKHCHFQISEKFPKGKIDRPQTEMLLPLTMSKFFTLTYITEVCIDENTVKKYAGFIILLVMNQIKISK
jgi:hypothetical protein